MPVSWTSCLAWYCRSVVAVGEFGVILMLGGSIPGETQVLSVLIYDHTEAMNYAQAQQLSLGLLVSAFAVLFIVYGLNRRNQRETVL